MFSDRLDQVCFKSAWKGNCDCFPSTLRHVSMEACFRHWIKIKKRLLWLFISQFWLFSQPQTDMFSELRVYISQFWEKKSELQDKKSELRVCITIMRKKCQNCEIKSHNNLFNFLFSGGNGPPYVSEWTAFWTRKMWGGAWFCPIRNWGRGMLSFFNEKFQGNVCLFVL